MAARLRRPRAVVGPQAALRVGLQDRRAHLQLPAGRGGLGPEHRALLRMCRVPVTVADVAADVALPLGVVRVLLGDLIQQGRITVLPPPTQRPQARTDLLKEVLDGLRAL